MTDDAGDYFGQIKNDLEYIGRNYLFSIDPLSNRIAAAEFVKQIFDRDGIDFDPRRVKIKDGETIVAGVIWHNQIEINFVKE